MTEYPSDPSRPAQFDLPRVALHAGLIAVGTLVIYILGACRTIYVGDSGELVAAAATLGIPHPSGYPLYVLLGHLWIHLLPIGSIAFRMSLLSAVLAAGTAALLYGLLRRLAASPVAAMIGALLLAFSPSFWSQANIQRVYALNALFVVLVIAAAWEWYRTRQIHFMVAAAFLAGLGATNHTAMAIHGVAVGLFAVAVEPRLLRRVHHLAACLGAGLLGLLPYLYLPIRSRQEPPLDWGDPDNLERFLDVVLRRDFWNRAWIESPADWAIVIGDYLQSLVHETLGFGLLLAILGLALGWRSRRKAFVILPFLAMLANLFAVGAHGSRSDIFIWHRYYIPSYVMLALLAGLGVDVLVRALRHSPRRHLLVGLLALPLALLLMGYPQFDRSRYRIAESFSQAVLDSLPPGARVAASDDNILFVLLYLKLAEGRRPDVHLIQQGIGGSELPDMRFDPDEDPIFFTHHPNWNVQGLEIAPIGLVFRTAMTSRGHDPILPIRELPGANDPRVPKDYLTQNLIGHFHYMLGITFESRDWPRARAEFEEAARHASRNDVLFYNLGLIYRRNGLLERSRDAFARSIEINPRRLANNKPVRASDRLAEVEQDLATFAGVVDSVRDRPELEGLQPGQAAYHRRLAFFLEAAGSPITARGQRLLAEEIEGQRGGSPLEK